MPLKKYPSSLQPDPQKILSTLLLSSTGVTSGPAVSYLPISLKQEAILIAQARGLQGDNFEEAAYWIIKDLFDYPKKCESCGVPVKFRSHAEAYMYARCSTKCSNSDVNVKLAKERSSLEKFGVRHHLAAPEIKQKIVNTNIEKYNVSHNMHRADVFNKNMTAQMRRKKHMLPSGMIVLLMGYEPYVVDWLISVGQFSEEQFDFNNIPSVEYFWGQDRIYHPDFFIPYRNLLMEVKSTYTWEVELDKNLAKLVAAKEKGFEVQLIIWDKKKNLPIEIRTF